MGVRPEADTTALEKQHDPGGVLCLYPYVEDAAITEAGVYSFTLPTGQEEEGGFEKADLLCAPLATASATDDAGNIGVLDITFRHALTRLTVVLERGNADGAVVNYRVAKLT